MFYTSPCVCVCVCVCVLQVHSLPLSLYCMVTVSTNRVQTLLRERPYPHFIRNFLAHSKVTTSIPTGWEESKHVIANLHWLNCHQGPLKTMESKITVRSESTTDLFTCIHNYLSGPQAMMGMHTPNFKGHLSLLSASNTKTQGK